MRPLDLIDAELDQALDRRVRAHQERATGRLSVAAYKAELRHAREVEDRLEPERRAQGATRSRAFDVALEEHPELRERVAEPCQWCGSECELGTCPRGITCPTCHAAPGRRCKRPSEHSGPMVATHARRIEAAELPGPPVLRPEPFQARLGHPTDVPSAAQNRALPPLAQQLDLDGGLHDLAPHTRQERLFEPAPFAQLDGQQYLDTEREER